LNGRNLPIRRPTAKNTRTLIVIPPTAAGFGAQVSMTGAIIRILEELFVRLLSEISEYLWGAHIADHRR
jgi:hypothetical protein